MPNDGEPSAPPHHITASDGRTYRRHPRLWAAHGTLVLATTSADAFRVDGALPDLQASPVLAALLAQHDGAAVDACPVLRIPDSLYVASADLEAALEQAEHDSPLGADTPFERVAAILRISSRRQLDFPAMHGRARARLEEMFPSRLHVLAHRAYADAALTLAVEHDVYPVQKALFYSLATHSDLEHDEPDGTVPSSSPSSPPPPAAQKPEPEREPAPAPDVIRPNLSPELTQRCKNLLTELVAHFTPVLFTVATAQHMACTDVFAETWMPLVIQPALENGGLCRPLETLQEISDLDWTAHGLCAECVKDKREEWRGEQQVIWDKMDEWLDLPKKDSGS